MTLPIPEHAYLRIDHFQDWKKQYLTDYSNKYLSIEFMHMGIEKSTVINLLVLYKEVKTANRDFKSRLQNLENKKFVLEDKEDELKLLEKFFDDLDTAANTEYNDPSIENYSVIAEVIRKFNPEAAQRLEAAKDKTYVYSDIRRKYDKEISRLDKKIIEKHESIIQAKFNITYALDILSKMRWAYATSFRNLYYGDNS